MESEVRSSRLPLRVLLPCSLVAVTVGVLAARGNGISPVMFGCGAVVVVPLIALGLAWLLPRRAKAAQIVVIVLSGVAAYALAHTSSRVDPGVGFERIFGVPPPGSVSELTVREAWFDGPLRLATFRISDEDLQFLVRSASLKRSFPESPSTEERRLKWKMLRDPNTTIARVDWPVDNPAPEGVFYESLDTAKHMVVLLYDPATGRVWAAFLSF